VVSKRKVLAGLVLSSVLVLSGCGSDDASSDDPESSAPEESESSATADPADSACVKQDTAAPESSTGKPGAVTSNSIEGVTVTGDPGKEPTVKIETPLEVTETEVVVRAVGDGEVVPDNASVSVNYVGYNARTGKTFDSSWANGGKPISFELNGVIAGFSKAIAGQKAGSQIVVAIAPDDGYGPAGGNEAAGIEPDDTLVFVLDIVSYSTVLEAAAGEVQEVPPTVPALELNQECVPTGFTASDETPEEVDKSTRTVLVKGDGPKVEAGQQLTVHYLGQFYPEGEIFDQSWENGEPATFGIGVRQVIPCWDELLPGATVGSRLVLVCTSDDAYGDEDYSDIPGGSTLTFAVDLLGVQPGQ
jgi:peptidylprolyl isomerase